MDAQTQAGASWHALLSGRNAVRSLTLAGGVALQAVNIYIGTTILPSVVNDIGGLELYAWNTTVFAVASILGSALSNRLLQRTGPRGAYAAAAVIFGAGSLVCALAPAMLVMLLGRFLQGLGGGFLFALSYAMIRLVFDERLWPRAMALVSAMWGIATLVGPAIGGVFAELGAWRAAFWAMLPVTALFLVLPLAALPQRDRARHAPHALPLAQLVLLSLAVLAVSAGSIGSNLVWNIAGVAAAIVLTGVLIRVEGRAPQRLLPRTAFGATPLGGLYLTLSLLAATVTSTEIFVPLFLQVLHGQTPLIAGYFAALMGGGWSVASILTASADERGSRRAILVSPMLALVGMAALVLLVPGPGNGVALAPIALALTCVGFGVGLGWPHLLTRVLQVASVEDQDRASASLTTVQLFATALGAALAGLVANLGGLTEPGGIGGTSSAARLLFGLFTLGPLFCLATTRLNARSAKRVGVEPSL